MQWNLNLIFFFRSLPNSVIDNNFTYRRKSSSQRSANSINSNIRKSSFDSNGQLPSFYDNDGYSGSDKDLTSSPVLVIKSKSSTRRVKTSLDRIARQNDEIFELWYMFNLVNYQQVLSSKFILDRMSIFTGKSETFLLILMQTELYVFLILYL